MQICRPAHARTRTHTKHCLNTGIVKLYYMTEEGSCSGNVNEQTPRLYSQTHFAWIYNYNRLLCKSIWACSYWLHQVSSDPDVLAQHTEAIKLNLLCLFSLTWLCEEGKQRWFSPLSPLLPSFLFFTLSDFPSFCLSLCLYPSPLLAFSLEIDAKCFIKNQYSSPCFARGVPFSYGLAILPARISPYPSRLTLFFISTFLKSN